jgi:predicted dehydrogenase
MHRRDFVRTTAASFAGAVFAPTIVPRHVLGGRGYRAPSDTVNVAGIGVGGQGMWNLSAMSAQANVVALADVDWGYVDESFAERAEWREEDGSLVFPELPDLRALYDRTPRYDDFRRMLDERGGDIDAVVVATPDHMHAYAALTAMQRGKHVFVQKPLTYTVEEARALKRAAASTGVVTQMGNQGHSGDDGRRAVELVRSGVIGPLREVRAWTNRPAGFWPQGVARSAAAAAPPPTLNWDLFLGVAPEQPYHPDIHPFAWRGWVDFGVGALGDMGAHILDFPFWALELGMPSRVETRHSPWGGDRERPDTYPVATISTYHFPRAGGEPLLFTWFDGGLMPPTPVEAPAGFQLDPGGGVMYLGERGMLIHDTYGLNPRLLPEGLNEEAAAVPTSLPRIEGGIDGHDHNFLRAIRGEEAISSPFSYGSDLTEVMLLGLVAARAGQPIHYDAAAMTIPNAPDAERFLRREYRAGWELPVIP